MVTARQAAHQAEQRTLATLRRTRGGLELAAAWLALPAPLRRTTRSIIEALVAAQPGEEPGRTYVTGGDEQ